MNVYRDYLQGRADHELFGLWMEIEQWEKSGALPEDAFLRSATRAAFKAREVDMYEDMGMNVLQVQFCGHEVWREIARRALNGTWT